MDPNASTRDAALRRWSTVLLALAALVVLRSVAAPALLLSDGGPIVLTHGTEVWQTRLHDLPRGDAGLFLAIILLPQAAWLYGVVQIARLARFYRRGVLFAVPVSGAFLRLGGALIVMGALDTLILPAVAHLFHARGITPWLADIPLLAIVEVDLIMAGAFFFILGKIMQRGAELQETDRLTV